MEDLRNMEAEKLAYSETREVVKYFEAVYFLPSLERDSDREILRNTELKDDGIHMGIVYPLKILEKIDEAASLSPSSYRLGVNISYFPKWKSYSISFVIPNEVTDGERRIMDQIKNLEERIQTVNTEIRVGNSELKQMILSSYEELKKRRIRQLSDIDAWIKKLPVRLVEMPSSGAAATFKLPINPAILSVIPSKERPEEPSLDRANMNTIVDLIKNVGLLFERAPKTFSKLDEEELRDVILAGLNMFFKGAATGETFSVAGKTDIHLAVSSKDVLIAECKKWTGESGYKDAIDQLFSYTAWRDSFGIIIAFSSRKGFTSVMEKAQAETKNHPTYLEGSFKIVDSNHYVTRHLKAVDDARQIEVHHLLFTLFS